MDSSTNADPNHQSALQPNSAYFIQEPVKKSAVGDYSHQSPW